MPNKWRSLLACYINTSDMYVWHDAISWVCLQVPFGRFGFIPGRMYHTNEVMVLLGDNWFAKRTAKQALEIAERRKQCMYVCWIVIVLGGSSF